MSPKETPSEPFETFPKPCRRPLFEASAEAPAGPPFGERHVSRRLSRKTLSKMTYVPEALPRIPPEAFFETPSEPATCSECRAKHLTSRILPELPRVPKYSAPRGFPPDVARVCHLSPSAERKPFLREPSKPILKASRSFLYNTSRALAAEQLYVLPARSIFGIATSSD